MKKYLLIIISFVFLSCAKKKNELFPFYGADKIEYYKVRDQSEDISSKNKELEAVIYSSVCADQNFTLEKTIALYYSKIEIPLQLNKTFIEHFPIPKNRYEEASLNLAFCAPIYRDIIIFKKKNKVIGISKVCFSCSQNFIVTKERCAKDIDLDYSVLKQMLDQMAAANSRHD